MVKRWLRSLSARLWLTSVAALAISLAILAVMVVHAIDHYPVQTLGRRSQLFFVRDVAEGVRFDGTGTPVAVTLTDDNAWLFPLMPTELRYRVLDAHGGKLVSSAGLPGEADWPIPANPADVVGRVMRIPIGDSSFYVSSRAIRHGGDEYYVQVATSSRLVDAIIRQKVRAIPDTVRTTFFIATIIFGLTLTFMLRRLLRPLRDASRAAERISPGNLATRLSASGMPSEIKPLINAFNAALDRVENGYKVQQRFLAAAAHELQTPLTLIRGQIELQPDIEDQPLLLRDIDMMARQVRQLLQLAEVSEAQNFCFGEVDCVEVGQDVVTYLSRRADARQVRLRVHVVVAPPARSADRSALFILLKNIVENAIMVTPATGTVTMRINANAIEVLDEGPGIHEDHLPRLFDRFWRAPDAKHDGAGLGLAICKEIAAAHDWRLTARNLASGASFQLRM